MLCLLRRARIAAPLPSPSTITTRLFTSSATALQKSMPSRPPHPPDSELEESYLKGSGPGGQKIVRLPFPIPLLSRFPLLAFTNKQKTE